ncbi:hypothetical protein GU926_07215 [Nibribacter ruber]|uniref:Uncharacterized protein n=1 Tax=Nibribacter ruber TaxID=2698458 RepID=A0A6P1NZB6_9BACT|nr:hypothetical protein [Nibribacter ruber]QHL87231.1 hypothetical protein GU926_07215 [Nibribacter ruber]
MRRLALAFLFLVALTTASFQAAQDPGAIDFYPKVQAFDLSSVLAADSISIEDEQRKIEKQEPFGFIGDDYQRFFIHFTSVIKNPDNAYQYLVYGKSRVKDTVCDFQGTITVKSARLLKESDHPTFKQGMVVGEYKFYENGRLPATGFLQGKVTTDFYLDEKQKIHYDDLMFSADGFKNNQFQGTWTSYKTGITKKCNWGDYRIPSSGDLDIGAGEFSVNGKYIKNGWQNYMKAFIGNPDLPETKKAKATEEAKWWK